jgi:putative flippase GtrA
MERENPSKGLKKQNIIKRLLLFLRYTTSSFVSTLAEYFIYIPLVWWLLPGHPVISFNISRAFGSALNFLINEKFVFEHPKQGRLKRMLKHYCLVVAIAFCANWMIVFLYDYLEIGELMSKLITDVSLFFVRLVGQKLWVFGRSRQANPQTSGSRQAPPTANI